jgi:hypothetical protein
MRFFRRRRKGQAAVEAMLSIPVMLLVFAIGCELFAITYNAQYAHVKARYKLMKDQDHKPCKVSGDGRVQAINKFQDQASATTNGYGYTGLIRATSQPRTMRARAVIVCN